MYNRNPPSTQRGAILVYAAIALSIAIILLASIDIGHFFYTKRELQKIADLSAIAGAQVLVHGDCTQARASSAGNASQNGWDGIDSNLTRRCGHWSPAGSFVATAEPLNAMQVTAARDVASFIGTWVFASGGKRVTATSIAKQDTQLAVLNLRSTLVSVDSGRSALLNAIFGGLLGGSVNLTAVGWQGLVDTEVNLLAYLDQLALNLGLTAGDYEGLLDSQVAMAALLQAAIDLMQRGSGSAADIAAIAGLVQLQGAIPPGWLLRLSDLIQLQQGMPSAGLDANIQLFSLVQALVQVGNGQHGIVASVPISLPGLANVTLRTSVIEPPQISAIGDPALAKADPFGPDAIYVRTAQVRSVVSVNLPTLSAVTGLLSAVGNLASPVTTLLNDLLHLNLVAGVGNLVGALLGIPKDVVDILVLPPPVRIDVNLDVAAGEARVTDFQCNAGANRSLRASATTAAASLRVGKIDTAAIFSSHATPVVAPLPLIDIGARRCTKVLLLPVACDPRRPFVGGGVGVKIDTMVASSGGVLDFDNPPELYEAPAYQSIVASNLIASLASTLDGVQVDMYAPQSPGGGGIGGLLVGVGNILNGVAAILQPVIRSVLSPLLDPLVNTLLDALGVDLAKLDVGARLSCGTEAELVL